MQILGRTATSLSIAAILVAAFAAAPPSFAADADAPAALTGFTPAGAVLERGLEARFAAQLEPRELREWMQHLAAQPNQVGSPHDRENAQFVAGLARSWGWKVHIETFDVLYPTPLRVSLEMTAPTQFAASLREPPIEGDRSSQDPQGALPPYVAFGADGDVSGELVYVNYGMPADYLELARRGISVNGRIVIARYGGGWRGLKPKLAQEHGAIGCVIYSDPRDDGFYAADPYPKGAGRPLQGVQRGSVLDVAVEPGDPLTPGIGATRGAKRIAIADVTTIMKIPVLPISAADAAPLLAALGGPVASPGARGALPFTYHVGPGPARVHLAVQSEWTQKTLYDVIAELRGSDFPDQWVIRGNHRDGWVFGAEDPLSGHVAMLAEMKALGALARGGWRPRRTLVYASWDGEEPGLLGSTEWVEAHLAQLQKQAVAYVNTDMSGRGGLGAGGSHSLERLLNEVAGAVRDPQTGATVLARARAAGELAAAAPAATEEQRQEGKLLAAGGDLPLEALGSGSDYTPFLQHAGIASLNFGFGGEQPVGDYHSTYDSFEHFASVVDPDFAYEVTLADFSGRLMLRLADADVLPYRFAPMVAAIGRYVAGLEGLAQHMREATLESHRLLDAHAYELAPAVRDPLAPPLRESSVPAIDFGALDRAVTELKASAGRLDARLETLTQPGGGHGSASGSLAARRRLGAALAAIEQSLTDPRGLPGRPWYRHLVYAPGLLTGYGAKTVPGVREALEARRWDEAVEYIARTAQALAACREQLDVAAAAAAAVGE